MANLKIFAFTFGSLLLAGVVILTMFLLEDLGKETKARTKLWADADAAVVSINGPITEAANELKSAAANLNKLSSQTYYDQVAAVETANKTINNANNLIWDLRAGLFGGKVTGPDSKQTVDVVGLLPQLTGLVEDFRGTNRTVIASLESITGNTNGTITQATASLQSVQALIDTATKELVAGDVHVTRTIDELEHAIKSADVLIADPNLSKTIGHIEHTTETMAIVTDPWRKKANQILAALKFAVSLLHINLP